MLRFGPSQRAAKIALADAQLHRHQIVDSAGHAFAGETDQQTAIAHKFCDTVCFGDLADIGEHKHANFVVQQARDVSLA